MFGTVNAGREHFEMGVKDLALVRSDVRGLAQANVDASGQRLGKLRAGFRHLKQRGRI